MEKSVPVIVITGGPCGGKSTLLKRLQSHFTEKGYRVIVLPEVATELMKRGISPTTVGNHEFQRRVLRACIAQEEKAKAELAQHPGPCVIFADRGVMDGLAYIDDESMRQIWDEFGHNLIELRDLRYKGVVYLESTGVSLPHLFSNETNEHRYERSAEEAAATCERTLAAWIGCPHLGYVDNSTDFDEKMDRAITWVEYFLGDVEREKKFLLLGPFNDLMLPEHRQPVEIFQSYIREPNTPKDERIRQRGQQGYYMYFQAMKQTIDRESCTEVDRVIPDRKYAHLHGTARIPGHAEVVKYRWCFVANGYYWELDVFRDWHEVLLEVEIPHPAWKPRLPSFLEGRAIEVTGNREYMNRSISKKIFAQQGQ